MKNKPTKIEMISFYLFVGAIIFAGIAIFETIEYLLK